MYARSEADINIKTKHLRFTKAGGLLPSSKNPNTLASKNAPDVRGKLCLVSCKRERDRLTRGALRPHVFTRCFVWMNTVSWAPSHSSPCLFPGAVTAATAAADQRGDTPLVSVVSCPAPIPRCLQGMLGKHNSLCKNNDGLYCMNIRKNE